MPDVAADDRIEQLKTARDAAKAVLDEIDRLNRVDPRPGEMKARRRKRDQARGDIQDLENVIDDEEAATKSVTISDEDVASLQVLAAKLDKAIVASALRSGGLASATKVLNGVAELKGILGA